MGRPKIARVCVATFRNDSSLTSPDGGAEIAEGHNASELLVRQSEGSPSIGRFNRYVLRCKKTASASRDHHDLFMRSFSEKRHGRGVAVGLKANHPEFLARARIKGTETLIICARNKNESAGCGNRTAEIRDARLGNPLRFQLVHNAKGNLPGNFPGVQIDRI